MFILFVPYGLWKPLYICGTVYNIVGWSWATWYLDIMQDSYFHYMFSKFYLPSNQSFLYLNWNVENRIICIVCNVFIDSQDDAFVKFNLLLWIFISKVCKHISIKHIMHHSLMFAIGMLFFLLLLYFYWSLSVQCFQWIPAVQ